MPDAPILWSFRRCPYAIRARLAIRSAGLRVVLREILLRDKPHAFLQASPSATVPALILSNQVLDESIDIMKWALGQNDPHGLTDMLDDGWHLIERNDGPFKTALDHTKYASRFPDRDAQAERAQAAEFLIDLDHRLQQRLWLFGETPKLADLAILPFVRQFANTDRSWFEGQPWPDLVAWLDRFIDSADFAEVMGKYPTWTDGDPPLWFEATRR